VSWPAIFSPSRFFADFSLGLWRKDLGGDKKETAKSEAEEAG
jgi:hypothetical protein